MDTNTEACPAFDHGFDFDVFLSYPRALDKIIKHGDGWVSAFVEHLKSMVRANCDRGKELRIWMDHREVRGQHDIEQRINEGLAKSAVLLVVLSRHYHQSEWCEWEYASFRKGMHARRERGDVVFAVDCEPDKRPPGLENVRGFTFYEPNSNGGGFHVRGHPIPIPACVAHQPYWDALRELSDDLVHELSRLQAESQAQRGGAAATKITREPATIRLDDAPVVYLTPPAPDVWLYYRDLRHRLAEQEIKVIPGEDRSEPLELEPFRNAVREELAHAAAVVQLLGLDPGGRPRSPAAPSFAVLIDEIARDLGKTVLTWRHPELVRSAIEDPAHAALVSRDGVLTLSLPKFAKLIAQAVQPTPAAAAADRSANPLLAPLVVGPNPRPQGWWVVAVNPLGTDVDALAEAAAHDAQSRGHHLTLIVGPGTEADAEPGAFYNYFFEAKPSKVKPFIRRFADRFDVSNDSRPRVILVYEGEEHRPQGNRECPGLHFINVPRLSEESISRMLERLREEGAGGAG